MAGAFEPAQEASADVTVFGQETSLLFVGGKGGFAEAVGSR